MGLKLVPDQTDIKFMGLRMVAMLISLALIIGSIGAFFTLNLNYGIDFKGGVTIDRKSVV